MNEIRSASSSSIATPPPDTNRATLSQAWYSALYGDRSRATSTRSVAADSAERASSQPAARTVSLGTPAHRGTSGAARAASARGARSMRFGSVVAIVRSRSAAACSTAAPTAPAWREAATARRSTLALDLGAGRRVDVLVQRQGRRVHLVALAHALDETTADALDRALRLTRRQLALHGLHCTTGVHEKGSR